jgi:putative SOS response-associated peptidase YedK
LIPSWAEDPKIGYRMIIARSETAADKPAFRHAFRRKRCLIAADGFYEWQKTGAKTKQQFYIHRRDGKPFAFAGLWEVWSKGEEPVESCTILTTEANDLMRPLHDRMPVILDAKDYDRWLDPAQQDPKEAGAITGAVPRRRFDRVHYLHAGQQPAEPRPAVQLSDDDEKSLIVLVPARRSAEGSKPTVA